MKGENTGNWKVTRFCCNSGLCAFCHARGNHGDLTKRARVVHAANVSKEYADRCVLGWARFDARAEKMPEVTK